MSVRRPWIAFVVIVLLALAGLLATGATGRSFRTFALGAPNAAQIALVQPGLTVCEGAVTSSAAAGAVEIWAASDEGLSEVITSVRDAATGARLASGATLVNQQPSEYSAGLDDPVRAGRPLNVCLTNRGPQPLSLLGSAPVRPTVVAEESGRSLHAEFSLVLMSAGHPSEIGLLGTAFARAALWRPSWVGSWTFWLLVAGLLATIPLGAFAIGAAFSEDEDAPESLKPGDPESSAANTSRQ
jgi:hypothetical protein